MYKEHSVKCRCGKHSVYFHFKDNILPPGIIKCIFCPDCVGGIAFDPISMLGDNGWIIHYDMKIASLYRSKLSTHDMDNLLPEMLFNKGYATWHGTQPEEHLDSLMERCECGALIQNLK